MTTRFPALLGPMLEERRIASGLLAVSGVQITLTAFHLPGWPCPFRWLTGIPCPGCGLTRAVASLVQGRWHAAVSQHAFAPVALACALLLLAAALLPTRPRHRLASAVSVFERRTGSAPLLALALVVYWLLRLLYTPAQ